jgi:hypothetical protein
MQRIEVNCQTGEQTIIDLTQEEIDAINANQPEPVIPSTITMRQCRLQLLTDGDLATVTPLITAAGEAAQIEWEYAADVRRDHPLFLQMAAALGKTDADVDAFFLAASVL